MTYPKIVLKSDPTEMTVHHRLSDCHFKINHVNVTDAVLKLFIFFHRMKLLVSIATLLK